MRFEDLVSEAAAFPMVSPRLGYSTHSLPYYGKLPSRWASAFLTSPMPDALEMLRVDVSINCMVNDNFKAELAVVPLDSNVAAVPDDASAKALSFLGSYCCQNQYN